MARQDSSPPGLRGGKDHRGDGRGIVPDRRGGIPLRRDKAPRSGVGGEELRRDGGMTGRPEERKQSPVPRNGNGAGDFLRG